MDTKKKYVCEVIIRKDGGQMTDLLQAAEIHECFVQINPVENIIEVPVIQTQDEIEYAGKAPMLLSALILLGFFILGFRTVKTLLVLRSSTKNINKKLIDKERK